MRSLSGLASSGSSALAAEKEAAGVKQFVATVVEGGADARYVIHSMMLVILVKRKLYLTYTLTFHNHL